MEKPRELEEAELVYGLCKMYTAMPAAGGVLDQSVAVLRMHGILHASGYFEKSD